MTFPLSQNNSISDASLKPALTAQKPEKYSREETPAKKWGGWRGGADS